MCQAIQNTSPGRAWCVITLHLYQSACTYWKCLNSLKTLGCKHRWMFTGPGFRFVGLAEELRPVQSSISWSLYIQCWTQMCAFNPDSDFIKKNFTTCMLQIQSTFSFMGSEKWLLHKIKRVYCMYNFYILVCFICRAVHIYWSSLLAYEMRFLPFVRHSSHILMMLHLTMFSSCWLTKLLIMGEG